MARVRFFFTVLCLIADNPVTLPGLDERKAYVSTANSQYHDDAEEILHGEVFSNYGDLLVSFRNWGLSHALKGCRSVTLAL